MAKRFNGIYFTCYTALTYYMWGNSCLICFCEPYSSKRRIDKPIAVVICWLWKWSQHLQINIELCHRNRPPKPSGLTHLELIWTLLVVGRRNNVPKYVVTECQRALWRRWLKSIILCTRKFASAYLREVRKSPPPLARIAMESRTWYSATYYA